ncbi:MAG: DinB family protein [Bacteroidales bacterium]
MRFSNLTEDLRRTVKEWEKILLNLDETVFSGIENHQGRTIKQIIGHLVDSASNNHQRIVRLQYNQSLIFPDYTINNDTWIRIQHYADEDKNILLQLWKYYNLHLAYIIDNVDEFELNNSWLNGENELLTLTDVINGYFSHFKLHLGEIKNIILTDANEKNRK